MTDKRKGLFISLAAVIGGGALLAALLLSLNFNGTKPFSLSIEKGADTNDAWILRGETEPRHLTGLDSVGYYSIWARGRGCYFFRKDPKSGEKTLYYSDGWTDVIVERGQNFSQYLSADGTALLYLNKTDEKNTLSVFRAGRREILEVAENPVSYVISPTGTDVLYTVGEDKETQLRLLHGKEDTLIADGQLYEALGVSADGRYLYAARYRKHETDNPFPFSFYSVVCFDRKGNCTELMSDCCFCSFNSDLSEIQCAGPSGTCLYKNGTLSARLSDLCLTPVSNSKEKPLFPGTASARIFSQTTLYGINQAYDLSGEPFNSMSYYLTRKNGDAVCLYSSSSSVGNRRFAYSNDRKTLWFVDGSALYRVAVKDPEKRIALGSLPADVEFDSLFPDEKGDRVFIKTVSLPSDRTSGGKWELYCISDGKCTLLSYPERTLNAVAFSDGILYLAESEKDSNISLLRSVGGKETDEQPLVFCGFLTDPDGRVYVLDGVDGKRITRLENGVLLANDGDGKFDHVPDWYGWEREQVKKQIGDGTYRLDCEVDICMMVDYKSIYRVGEGRLIHDKNGFLLTGCDGKLEYRQSPLASYGLYADYYWYEIGDVICIGDRDKLFYLFPKNAGDVVAKTRMAAEELYRRCRRARTERNDGKQRSNT